MTKKMTLKERYEDQYHLLSWAEFEERYGESPADFEEERDKSLYQLECEAAGENVSANY